MESAKAKASDMAKNNPEQAKQYVSELQKWVSSNSGTIKTLVASTTDNTVANTVATAIGAVTSINPTDVVNSVANAAKTDAKAIGEKFLQNAKAGAAEAVTNSKAIESAVADMTMIAGQKPIITKAKKSIAAFKLREGMPIGVKVTLRGNRMYEFLDKFMNIALPRVRDFRGVNPKSFDGRGNYSIGLKEQLIFPEIDYDKVDKVRGMDVIIVTTAKTDEEGRELLKLLGMPFGA